MSLPIYDPIGNVKIVFIPWDCLTWPLTTYKIREPCNHAS